MNHRIARTALFAAAVACGWMTACGPKTAQTETVNGRVLDASMNTVTVRTEAGDTLTISTLGADPAKIQGVLIDDSVSLTCRTIEVQGHNALEAQELNVTAHSPYFYIQGQWVEPNPIDSTAVQGFALNEDGTAASIGMATLQITCWNLTAPKALILTGESIGNGQTLPMCDTLTVLRLDADSLVLGHGNGHVAWRLGRQK